MESRKVLKSQIFHFSISLNLIVFIFFFEHIQDQTVLGGGSFLMHSIKSSDFMQKAKKLSFFRRHPRPFSSASLFRGPICFCVDDAGQMGTVKISWIQVSHADLGIR
jgi:hypothetical protein